MTDEGRIRLHFTPPYQARGTEAAFTPLHDAAGVLRWGRQEQQAEEVYSWLSWTITVAANEYVVLGTPLGKGETLGEQFFLSGEENPGVQRLLVLRTAHVPTPGQSDRGTVRPLAAAGPARQHDGGPRSWRVDTVYVSRRLLAAKRKRFLRTGRRYHVSSIEP